MFIMIIGFHENVTLNKSMLLVNFSIFINTLRHEHMTFFYI